MKCWQPRGPQSRRNSQSCSGVAAGNERLSVVRACQPPQSRPWREGVRRLDIGCEADCLECPGHPPTKIDLAREDADVCRPREGLMVVVPAFAHTDQPGEPDIIALGSHAN